MILLILCLPLGAESRRILVGRLSLPFILTVAGLSSIGGDEALERFAQFRARPLTPLAVDLSF